MRLKYIRIAGLTIGGLVLGGIALLHTPPAKRMALHELQAAMAQQGIRLEASGLDFNLLSLKADMRGVVVTPRPGMSPLAKIESLTLQLSLWDLIRGHFVVSNATLGRTEVWIVIDANGLSNLPESKSSGGEPFEYLVESLKLAQGSLRIDDARDGLKIWLPQWDLNVTGNRLTRRHQLTLGTQATGSAVYGEKDYALDSLRAVLDSGRDDAKLDLALRTPGATLSGYVSAKDFNDTALAGKLVLDASIDRFAKDFQGQVHAEVTIAGKAKAPLITAKVNATGAGWQTYQNVDITGDFGYDPAAKAITAKGLSVVSALANASGDGAISLGTAGPSWFNGGFQRVAVNRFIPTLASTANGTVRAQWKGFDLASATVDSAITLAANRPAVVGVYPVAGSFHLRHTPQGTNVRIDRATLSGIEATGAIAVNARKQLSGQLSAKTDNIAAQPYAQLPVAGPLTLQAKVGGTVAQPSAEFTVDAPNLRAEGVTGIALTASGRANADRLDLDQAQATWNGQSITARGSVGTKGPIALQAEAVNLKLDERLTNLPVSGVANLQANLTGTMDRPEGLVTVNVADLEAYGEKLGTLSATVHFDKTSATVPDLLLAKAPSEKLTGKGTYEFDSKQFTATVQSDPLKLTKGTVAINATGSGTVAEPAVKANLKGDLNDIGPLELKAELNGEALRLTAFAKKQNLNAEATASTVAPYPFLLDVKAQDSEIETVKLTGTMKATGEAANWKQSEATLRAEAISMLVEGQKVRTEGVLEATYKRGEITLKPATFIGPGARITAEGQAPGLMKIDGEVNLATAHKAFRPSSEEAAAGELKLSGTVKSTLQAGRYSLDPQVTFSLTDGFYYNAAISPITGAKLQARLGDGDLRIETLEALWANANITGKAALPLGLLPANLPFDFARKGGAASAELSIKELKFAHLEGVPEMVGGQTSFTASLEAARPELEAVKGTVKFDELLIQAGKFQLAQEGQSLLNVDSGTVQVAQFTLAGQGAKVQAEGTAQFTGAQALQLKVDSNLDMAVLSAFTDTVRAQGATVVALAIGGTVKAPLGTGYLQVTDADLSVTSPRVQAEKVNLRLDIAGERVVLSRLSGTLNGGTLAGSGGFSLNGNDVDLKLASKGVYLDFPANLKTLSNADLSLRSVGKRLLLGGNVTIIEGSYTEPLNLDQGLLNVLNTPPNVDVGEDRSPLLERLDYGIAIKTENPLVVDNNLAKAEIVMNARLTGNYYRPGLVGRVTIDEGGELNLNERKYLVDRGVLTFTDENRIEPSFDIIAKTQASGYDVTLSLQGSGKERQTTLTSDPALPEPDIAAVLLTGRTLDELQGQELDVAKEQVLSYVTGRVGGSLGRGLERATGLSQVRIEPNLIANESDPSARLTVGQNLTRRLSLIYSMNLTDSGDQILVGQYEISKRFRTRALKQSDNSYRFDFSRKQEFGGTPPEPSTTAEREKKKIGQVAFSGTQIFTQEQLAKWLAARQGKTYDFFKVRRGVERITNKYADAGHLEARVRLNRETKDAQVDLDLNVEAGPKVDFVYEGFKPIAALRKSIRKQWLAGVFDAQRADDAATILREDLARRGYLAAKVDYTIEIPEPGRKRVVFDVQTGDKFDTPKLAFAGAKGIEEKELRNLLRDQKLTLAALSRPQPAIDLLTRHYRDRGYLDVKIAKPEVVLKAPTRAATIIYPIVEGPLYEVGNLKFSGTQAYRPEELLRAVTLVEGYDYLRELREETLANLLELYSRKGYNDADVTYTLDRRPATGKVDLNFQITEGPQSVVDSINVTGNDHTSQRLIRSQIELKPGDPLDPQILSHSRRNLYTTGAYSLIDMQRNPLDPIGGRKPISLDVNVREVRPFQVNYGGYFDTERGPGGIADFSNRNSLGSARVIGVRTRYDADLQEARTYFTQPLLKRFPLRTTASAFVRREVREGFNTDRVGFSVLQESRFGKAWILNYGYRLERTHTYDRGPDPIFDLTLRVAPFTVALSRDTRDDLLDATRGSFQSHAVEYAPTFSGSELNFAKYFGQYFRYFAFDKPALLPMQKGVRKSRLVFATGVRVGLAAGLNGQDLIPGKSATNRVSLGERFFAGGGTTIRGFAQDGVGPRQFDAISPTGGDALFILNNELRFPLKGIFDGVSFLDVGNVYDKINDFRPWTVRKAAGFGIRVRTPYFLIRLDYGIKLDRKPGEPLGRPFFSIGQAF